MGGSLRWPAGSVRRPPIADVSPERCSRGDSDRLDLGDLAAWLTEREEQEELLSKLEAPAGETVRTESADCR